MLANPKSVSRSVNRKETTFSVRNVLIFIVLWGLGFLGGSTCSKNYRKTFRQSLGKKSIVPLYQHHPRNKKKALLSHV